MYYNKLNTINYTWTHIFHLHIRNYFLPLNLIGKKKLETHNYSRNIITGQVTVLTKIPNRPNLLSSFLFENTSVLFHRQTNWCKTKGQIFWQNHIISWLQKDNKEWSKLGPSILHSSGIIYRNSVLCLSYLSFSSAISSAPQNIHVFHHVPSSSNEEYKVNSEEPCKTEAEVKGIWQPDRKSFWFFQQRNSSPNQCTC